MPQAEAVSHLVACDKPHCVADHFLGQLHRAYVRICRSGLYYDPVVKDVEHVVPPYDVGFENFAGAGVADRRAHGVRFGGCGVCEGGVVHVIDIDVRHIGHLLNDDCVFPSGAFESLVPLFDAFGYVWTPLARSRVVEIDDDGLCGFDKLATQICGLFARFWLHSPSLDEVLVMHPLLVVGEIERVVGEITDLRAYVAPCHRFLGQENQRGAHFDGDGDRTARLGHFCREFGDGVYIVVESLHRFDFREVGFGGSTDVYIGENIAEGILTAVEKVGDLHNHSRRIGGEGFDLERSDKGEDIVQPKARWHLRQGRRA